MKIVFLCPVGFVGGAERCLLTLVDGLRRADASVESHVICCGEGPLAGQMRDMGAIAHVLPMPASMAGFGESGLRLTGTAARLVAVARGVLRAAPATLRYAKQLGNLIRSLSPDVVHSNGMKTHLLSRLIGTIDCPVLWHVHDFVGTRPLMARGLRLASGRCAGCIAISQSVAEDLRRVLPGVAINTVMNATDTDRFAPGDGMGDRLDFLAGLEPPVFETVRIGLVATYARWKGQDVFIKAASLLKVPRDKVRFYVIGGPVYATAGSQFSEAELLEMAATQGVSIGFVPFQVDPVNIYRSLDVVVHGSTQPEPFGLTIIEAMACGKPVVVSAAGGAKELFTDGVDGLGYTPGNADELATALSRLSADPALRARLGGAARASVVAKFDQSTYGEKMLSVYRQAAATETAAE